MNLSLSWKPTFAYGTECKWEVPDKDIIEMEGTKFVQLRQGGVCYGFPRLVLHEASRREIEFGPKARWSLSSSKGYKVIQKLRNDAQSEELLSKLPEWQRATAKPRATKRPKEKANGKAKHDVSRSSISIEVPGVEGDPPQAVRVVRPMYAHEELRVELDAVLIHHIVKFLAESGFDALGRKRERDPEVPKGVHRRKIKGDGCEVDKFIVTAKGSSNRRSKLLSSLESAVIEQEGLLHEQGVGEQSDNDGVIEQDREEGMHDQINHEDEGDKEVTDGDE